MGLLDTLQGTKDFLVGKDSESTTTTGPTSGTKVTTDSGQKTDSTTSSTGTSSGTSTTAGTKENSSSSYSGTATSGRTDTVTIGGRTQTKERTDQINTSQVLLSQDAVNYLVKGILESNAGLANITGGAKGGGIYNDTTTQMLTNDLLARTAGEVAVRSAVTKTVIGGVKETETDTGQTTTTNIGGTYTQSIGKSSNIESGSTTTNTSGTTTNTGTGTSTTGPRTIQEVANTSGSTSNTNNDQKGLLDWIVCSELRKQNRMSLKYYTYGGKKFLEYDDKILKGYYIWAEPSVKHLRKYPNSIYSHFLEHVFNERAKNYTNEANPYTMFIAASVYAFCWILSRTIARTHTYVREEKSYG